MSVTTAGGTSSTSPVDQFSYDPAPTVTAVSPSSGSTAGGANVTISGTNFVEGATSVSFGNTAVTGATVDSPTQITVAAPAQSIPGAVDVTVVTPGGTSTTGALDTFSYEPAPAVMNVSPAAGPTAGGTAVTISGANFIAGATTVAFGGTQATATTVDSTTQVTATAPAGSAGAVDISVTTSGGTSATSAADRFSYDAAPVVGNLTPSDGPLAGGETVDITGTGFTGARSVRFGSTPATSFTVRSDSLITATAPADSATGTVSVTVTTPGGISAAGGSAVAFTYQPLPAVFGVSPATATTAGGTQVTLTGTGFSNAIAVDFGSSSAAFTVQSDAQIIATAPPGAVGAVDVTVTTPNGRSAINPADGFSYNVGPTATLGSAKATTPTSAQLHGTVDPAGLPVTSCRFEIGTSPRYGRTVPCAEVAPDVAGVPIDVSAGLSGLTPGTKYHYRLVITTAAGTITSPDESFSTTMQTAVQAPFVGLRLAPLTGQRGYFAKLLGVQGIFDATPGESLVIRCVHACAHRLVLMIKLRTSAVRQAFTIAPALPLSSSTRIEIDVSGPGKLGRIARYAIALAGSSFSVKVVTSGCTSASGAITKCPRPAT